MFTFIDLFAGIGGMRLPFQELGGTCVFSSEIDKFACQTYAANWGETPRGDITKIDASDIPHFDLLLGGFPCQAFSVAGHKQGFADTRGTMFFEIERIIEYHQPSCFLLENVKGLISHNQGQTFATIMDILQNKLGYKVYYQVFDAKYFGVPQHRERIYIVGFKDHSIDFNFPTPPNIPVKLGDILESNVDKRFNVSDKMWEYHQARKQEQLAKGNGFGYCLFNAESPYTSTLLARYYKDGSEILVEQPGQNPRRLTPRECARLQGFPDSFKLVCSNTQCYKQFGNSVAVPVVRTIAQEICRQLGW